MPAFVSIACGRLRLFLSEHRDDAPATPGPAARAGPAPRQPTAGTRGAFTPEGKPYRPWRCKV